MMLAENKIGIRFSKDDVLNVTFNDPLPEAV